MSKKAPTNLYRPGDKVQIHDQGQWRDAVILSFAGYGGGYQYQFDPLPKREHSWESLPSSGGWTCDTFCRSREAKQ